MANNLTTDVKGGNNTTGESISKVQYSKIGQTRRVSSHKRHRINHSFFCCLISFIIIGFIVIMSDSNKADAGASSSTAFSYSSYTSFNRNKPVAASSSSEDDRDNKESSQNDDSPINTNSPPSSIPQLMPADPNDTSIPTVTLGGDAISLDALGPIVINLDGSTSRIDNWGIMTDREKEVTKRRIGKRNRERREMLLEKLQQQQEDEK
mmetsp:Transcript_25018/g.33171  ORF Transcript_25018/g.33171 Transcript_25018/m.33171 type:complete len:208 (-) Transcript_25018:1681-2304(-)